MKPGRPKLYHTAEALKQAKRDKAKRWYNRNKGKRTKIVLQPKQQEEEIVEVPMDEEDDEMTNRHNIIRNVLSRKNKEVLQKRLGL